MEVKTSNIYTLEGKTVDDLYFIFRHVNTGYFILDMLTRQRSQYFDTIEKANQAYLYADIDWQPQAYEKLFNV